MRTFIGLLLIGGLFGCASPSRFESRLQVDRSHVSRNQDSRAQFLVLHFTVGDFENALSTLTQGPVSSHYLISERDPKIYELVPESERAWHAGVSSWQGTTAINAASIGIEIVNRGPLKAVTGLDAEGEFAPFSDAQMEIVLALVKDIVSRHNIRADRIIGHSDIAPTRKNDPGPRFPWRRLAEVGLIPWPDAARVEALKVQFAGQTPDAAWFQSQLARMGYEVTSSGQWDRITTMALAAFQMRQRPTRYDGKPDVESAAVLQATVEAFARVNRR